jgi:glycosyltransferase involved in cell wall biosynthesis
MMACGRPVAITPVGLAPKLIRDGENGVLIYDRSVDGVAEALCRLRSMDREAAGRKARAAVEPFDWRYKLENWRDVLNLAEKR